ncbi:MAG: hypothetical protein AAF620_17990 [Bacteroidota bacterium]
MSQKSSFAKDSNIYLSSSPLKKKDFETISKFLKEVDIEDYFVYVCNNTSVSGASELILGVNEAWLDFDYSDFLEIMNRLNNNEIGLFALYDFLG